MLDSGANFFVRNKLALLIATVAGASAIGAILYYQNQISDDSDGAKDAAGKKKKQKKKKKTKGSDSNGAIKESESKLYPVDSDGNPAISDEFISSLSDKDIETLATSLKESGNSKFKAQKYEEAMACYTAALKLKSDAVFFSNRSACYAALNDHENVIKDTTEAIKLQPEYTKCILRRATSFEILEKYTDAMFDLTALTIYGGYSNKSVEQVLERVLRKHSLKIVEERMKSRSLDLPSASTSSSFFGAFLHELSPEGISESSTGADKLLFDALKKLNENTPSGYEEADKLFNQAIKEYKVDEVSKESLEARKAAIALEYAAAMKFLRNDPLGATELIEKAIGLHPRAKSYVFMALILADKASFAEALKDFELAAKLDPSCADVYYHLGQLYYLTGDLKLASDNFEKAKELNPDNVYAYIQLACIAYKNGQSSDSDAKFQEAKLKFPTSPEVPNYFGEILADKNDIQGALKLFDVSARLQEAVPQFSVGAMPLVNKATLLSRQNPEGIAEAEKLLEKACEIDPKSEIARISLAQISLQKGEVDAAIDRFEESSDLARSLEEKVQATSFAEATKMQKRIKDDPYLSKKISEMVASAGGSM